MNKCEACLLWLRCSGFRTSCFNQRKTSRPLFAVSRIRHVAAPTVPQNVVIFAVALAVFSFYAKTAFLFLIGTRISPNLASQVGSRRWRGRVCELSLIISSMENPWSTKSTRHIYSNPWIDVHEHEVIRPDGNDGIYGVVHFRNLAVGVLPVDDQGNVHLVGQFRYVLNAYSWEIPEGGCPEGENVLDAAKRELLEETGMTASYWTYMGKSHLSNSVADEVAHIYLATGLTSGTPQPEGTEVLAHKKVPFKEALHMVFTGEITDAISIMAILQYFARREIHA